MKYGCVFYSMLCVHVQLRFTPNSGNTSAPGRRRREFFRTRACVVLCVDAVLWKSQRLLPVSSSCANFFSNKPVRRYDPERDPQLVLYLFLVHRIPRSLAARHAQ